MQIKSSFYRFAFLFLLTVLTAGLIGCGGSSGGGGGGDDSSGTIETQQASFAGRVTDENGDPVKNAEVSVQSTGVSGSSSQYADLPTSQRASQYAKRRAQMSSGGQSYQAADSPRISETLTTDDKGFFDLDEVELREGYQYIISWEKDGHSGSTRRVTFTGDDEISLGSLIAQKADTTILESVESDSTTITDTTSSGDSTSVEIPAGSLQQSGNSVTGDVESSITASDPTTDTGQEAFPGDYQAASAESATPDTSLESVAYLDVDLTDDEGNPIRNIDSDSPVTIYQKPPERFSNLQPGDTVPWWSFDENQGVWVKEDAFPNDDSRKNAEVVNRDGDTVLKAKVTHFSSWNYDVPVPPPACFEVRVEDPQGNPLEGVTVRTQGVTYSNRFTVHTNESGTAYVPVKRDEDTSDSIPRATLSAKIGDKRIYFDDPGQSFLVDQQEANEDIDITNYDGWEDNPADSAPILETPDQACASSANARDLDQRQSNAFELAPVIQRDTQVTVSGKLVSNSDAADTLTNFEVNTLSGNETVTNESGIFELQVFSNSRMTLFTGLGYSEDFNVGESDMDVGTIQIPNQRPNISSLTEENVNVDRDGNVSLNVNADDPEGANLTYDWSIASTTSSDTGNIDPDGETATWNIPGDLSRLVNHEYTFRVSVDDGDSTASRGRNYTVPASLLSITADNTTVTPSTEVNLSAAFEGDDLDPCSQSEYTCQWTEETPDGDVYTNFSDSDAASPTWTAPFLDETRTLTLEVSDDQGNELSSNIQITVSPNEDLQEALTELGQGQVAEAAKSFDEARELEPNNGQAQAGYAISALASSIVRNEGLRDFSTDVLQAYKGEVLVGGDSFTTDVTADSLPSKDILSDTTFWESDDETLSSNFATSGSLTSSFARSSVDLSAQLISQAALNSGDAGYDTSISRLQDILVDLSEDTFTEAANALQTAIDNNASFEVQYKHTPDPFDHERDNASENDVLVRLEPHDFRVARSAIELLRGTTQFLAAHDLEVEDLTEDHIQSVVGTDPTLQDVLEGFPDLGSYRDSTRLLEMKNRILEATEQVKTVLNDEIQRREDSIDGNNTGLFDEGDSLAELKQNRNVADTAIRVLDGTLGYDDLLDDDESLSSVSNSMDIDLDGAEETLRTPSAFFDDPLSIRDLVYREGVFGGPVYNFPEGSLSFLTNDDLNESRISTAANMGTLTSVTRELPDIDDDNEPDSEATKIFAQPFEVDFRAVGDSLGNGPYTYSVDISRSESSNVQIFKNVYLYNPDTHVASAIDSIGDTDQTLQRVADTWSQVSVHDYVPIDIDVDDTEFDTAITTSPPLVAGFSAEFTDTALRYDDSFQNISDVEDTSTWVGGLIRVRPYRKVTEVTGFEVSQGNAAVELDIIANREATTNQFLGREDLTFGNYKVYGVVIGDSDSDNPADGTLVKALNDQYGSDGNFYGQIDKFEAEIRNGSKSPEDFNLNDVTTDVQTLDNSPSNYAGSFDVKTARSAITSDGSDRVGYIIVVPEGHYVYRKFPNEEGKMYSQLVTGGFTDGSLLLGVSGFSEPETYEGLQKGFSGDFGNNITGDIQISP